MLDVATGSKLVLVFSRCHKSSAVLDYCYSGLYLEQDLHTLKRGNARLGQASCDATCQ